MQFVTEISEEIAARLRRALLARGLSQTELAEKAGIDKGHLSKLLKGERGESTRKETREKLAGALDVDAQWLFAGYGPDPFGGGGSGQYEAVKPNDDRYPSKRAAAAALQGVVAQQAIEAMMSEEHSGSDGDPGADFWFDRGLWWDRKRRDAMGPPVSDLEDPPPLAGRPKKEKKR